MKFTTMMSVSAALREHHLRAEHLLKNFLFEIANPSVIRGEFLIRATVFAKNWEVTGVINLHVKSAICERHL